MYEFELRHYDAAIGRFVTADPYEQFSSPYLAMGNNPVVSFDPDGGYCYDSNGNQIACPDGDIYDDYRDNPDNRIDFMPEVVVTSNEGVDHSSMNGDVVVFYREVMAGMQIAPAMNERPDGFRRDFDEMMLNLFGYYSYQQYSMGPIHHVNEYGIVVAAAPEYNDSGAIGIIGGAAGGAARVSVKAMLKNLKLPITGKIRFIPRATDKLSRNILRKEGGLVDKFGNIWKKGPSRTSGEAFEWDVQLSAKGKAMLGHLSRDGKHLNVSLGGKITH